MSEQRIPHTGFERLPSVLAEIRSGIDDGLHLGAQVYGSQNSETVADAAVGWARAGLEMRPDSVCLWLSASKPVTSVAIAMLRGRGLIDIETPVAHYIPEFGLNGKQDITVRHVLTHTGGFLAAESADRLDSRDEIIRAICESPIADDWAPGERAAYQPTAGWHVLGEIILRITGRSVEDFVAEDILQPLGMSGASLAWTAEDRAALGERWVPMHRVTRDAGLEAHPAFTVEKMGDFARPGSSLRAPSAELGRLYEMLLNGGELGGTRLLSEDAVTEMSSRQRVGMLDETFGMTMDWGLGVIPDNKRYGQAVPYGYGPHASESSFGHGGSQSSIGFADPENGLAVAVIFNGARSLSHPAGRRRAWRSR